METALNLLLIAGLALAVFVLVFALGALPMLIGFAQLATIL